MRIDIDYVFELEKRMYRALSRLPATSWDEDMNKWYERHVSEMNEEDRAEHDMHVNFNKSLSAPDPSTVPQTPPNNIEDSQKIEGPQMNWYEDYNDYDSSVWELMAPYTDVNFYFRLRQRIEDNQIIWYSDSDEELGGDMSGNTWEKLDHAKSYMENAYENCLQGIE